jgi:cytochrome P450
MIRPMLHYDPFSADVMRDPYPVYARLREEAPVYHLEEYDAWALSRFEDVWNASMDNEHLSCAQGTTSAHLLTRVQPVTPMLNNMDPPEHTQLRSAVRRFFSPQALRNLEPMIRSLATSCLDRALERGECDVMADFASQISVKVACVVTGVPLEDGDLMNRLVWRFFSRKPGHAGLTPEGLEAMRELFAYLTELSHLRRRAGSRSDDIVTLLNEIEIGGRKLDDASIASHLAMFVIGGSETFPKVFANLIWLLARHPEQRAACARDPSLVPNAFLEGLRYLMPTQFLCRVVTREFRIREQTLRPGQPVLFLYPSANRDPREFRDPDVFDIRRPIPRLLSFGQGTHSCIGIHVAKMEGKVCLEETLRRIPDYELQMDRAERLVTDFVQGFAKLPIRF